MRLGFGNLQDSLGEVQQWSANRLGQPVGCRCRCCKREVSAHTAQSRLEDRHHPRLIAEQGRRRSGGTRCCGQSDDPAGDCGADRNRIECRRGQRHQDRQRVTRVGEWRGSDFGLRSCGGEVVGHGGKHVAYLVQDGVAVGVVLEFDHQPAQRTLDMGGGHTQNLANRLFDHRCMLVPARERQQRIQVQVHPPPALPTHGRHGAVRGAVRRTARAEESAGRLTYRLHHRACQRLHSVRGVRNTLHAGLQHLYYSTGYPADNGGYARNLHSSPFKQRLPRPSVLPGTGGCNPPDTDHRVGGRPNAESSPGSRKTVSFGDPCRPSIQDMYRMRPHDVVGGPKEFGNSRLPVGGRCDERHVAGFGEGALREESCHGVASGEPDRQRRHRNTIVPCHACASSSTNGVSTPNSASQPRRRRVRGAADR